ncbi:Dabb family protein [Chitinasiproducens palmae]|uniref:Stress responsive A/B Barrel Domain n=1 Tax=Chitinasiproducens palmae TaxID=1770053 RepID=A0A1H2PVT5_9BURK|nr:Dabb family protein [Chitinasiproducens palmae]SDV51459.1 Stress responsive A/B Barrel Domain [Chitinasiproducens palmae]
MIRHIVMWRLQEQTGAGGKPAKIAEICAALRTCAGLPGVVGFEVATATDGLASNFDIVLDSRFADEAALDAYQNHPTHQAILPMIRAAVAERACVDYAY